MTRNHYLRPVAAGAASLALIFGGILISAKAAGTEDSDSRIQRGLAITPVRLNLEGKDLNLVGLGSYLVNATGGCNDCHTNPSYLPGGDPFRGEPQKVNTHGFLGGGRLFIPANPPLPEIVARNLTPDKTGLPGGATFDEFLSIMRTGLDPDRAHPQYGPYLQVMPWPVYQNLLESDLRAMYEYLRAIPCIEGDPGLPDAPSAGTRCK